MSIFNYLLGALLMAAGVYFLYANIKTWKEASRQKKHFLQTHPQAQSVTLNKNVVFWNGVMAIGALVVAILLVALPSSADAETRLSQGAVYFGLALFACALWVENLEQSKVLYVPEGCIYSSQYIRYKQVRDIQVGKGFLKGSTLVLADGKEEAISRAMAKWMSEQREEWRKTRSVRSGKKKAPKNAAGKNSGKDAKEEKK